jgi:hypothetical protein
MRDVGGMGGMRGRPSTDALALAAWSLAESNHDPAGGVLSSFEVALDMESEVFGAGTL